VKHFIGLFVAVSLSVPVLIAPAKAEEVYMMRGFLNVFSDGMNQMTRQLRSKGIRARAISHGSWKRMADDIIIRSKRKKVSYPIVIAGHSLGGVEAPRMANYLGSNGVRVALVIGLDPGFPQPPAFGRGARRVINYKIPSGRYYRKGRGFRGSIQTVDVSRYGTDHVGIDENRQIQRMVISQIRRVVKK